MKRVLAPLCLALAAALPLHAEEQALIQSPSVAITPIDIQADSLRMPLEMRGLVLSKPQSVKQIASNLFVRRAMADQAQAQGLDQDPATAAALRIARDKVLSDAFLAKLDRANAPTDEAAEAMARSMYKAKPERFQSPEEVHARHILIAGDDAAARAQAEKLVEDIKKGADFAALAQERSADKGSAAKGGDLGFFARGRMVPEFEAAAFALQQPGQLSDVVQSKFGYHIIQLQARRPAGQRPFEEVRDQLVQEVKDTAMQQGRVNEAQKLQAQTQVNDEAIKALAATYEAQPKPAPATAGKLAAPATGK